MRQQEPCDVHAAAERAEGHTTEIHERLLQTANSATRSSRTSRVV
jgi:hypothetical protein